MTQAVSGRRRSDFDTRPVCVGFMVDRFALGSVHLRIIRFSPVSVNPPMLHTCISFINHGAHNFDVRGLKLTSNIPFGSTGNFDIRGLEILHAES
jgi:hypothetical protein